MKLPLGPRCTFTHSWMGRFFHVAAFIQVQLSPPAPPTTSPLKKKINKKSTGYSKPADSQSAGESSSGGKHWSKGWASAACVCLQLEKHHQFYGDCRMWPSRDTSNFVSSVEKQFKKLKNYETAQIYHSPTWGSEYSHFHISCQCLSNASQVSALSMLHFTALWLARSPAITNRDMRLNSKSQRAISLVISWKDSPWF